MSERKRGKAKAKKQRRVAVILIDMQKRFVCDLRREDKERIIPSQIEVIRFCAENAIPLVVLNFMGFGNVITELAVEIAKVPKRITLARDDNDGFVNPELEEYLFDNKIETVILMGINADFCVKATGHSAIQNGFKIATAESLIAGLPYHREDNNAPWYRKNGLFDSDHENLLNSVLG